MTVYAARASCTAIEYVASNLVSFATRASDAAAGGTKRSNVRTVCVLGDR
jgi:hypothetical protein